jgi:uncharacterized membrane protein YqgA involved in biofilm formation
MIATFINCLTVIIGSLLGLVLHKKIQDSFKAIVYAGAGFMALVLGIKMALETSRFVYLALALILGGILGEWWRVEGGILKLGENLKRRFARGESGQDFSNGFLTASVIFCVGAMTLVGAFKAGTEGDYTLILTKSVMDGFMAIMLTAAMGIGVAFSALAILIYQGGLTLLAGVVKPLVNDLLLTELTGVGGVLVIMIGFNLVGVTKIKTANYLPALLITVALVAVEPLIPFSL